MNKLTLSALLVASTLSFNALADDAVPAFKHESVGVSKTRAEVMAELAQARKEGKSYIWGANNLPNPPASATPRTRAEVMAELREAKATGEYALLHSDEPSLVVVKRLPKDEPALAGVCGVRCGQLVAGGRAAARAARRRVADAGGPARRRRAARRRWRSRWR